MKLHEFVGKKLLSERGISVPKSVLVRSSEDILKLKSDIEKLGFPQVLKSQVLVGGRMKKGGIAFSESFEETLSLSEYLFKKPISGELPFGILIEEMIEHEKEWYFSISINPIEREIMFIFSEMGGIDIEKVAKESSEKIIKGTERDINKLPSTFSDVAEKLFKIFKKYDLTLLEINPFTPDKMTALDAVVHIDDNALFRQKWAQEFAEKKKPYHFVKLDGNIGVIGCGAGIVMATMDLIKSLGCKPADFLDIGGGASKEVTISALEEVKKLSPVAIALNIFGGITKGDEVAKAIVEFHKNNDLPLFVRITGTNEDEARRILEEHSINVYEDMERLCKEVVNYAKEVKAC